MKRKIIDGYNYTLIKEDDDNEYYGIANIIRKTVKKEKKEKKAKNDEK